MDTKQTPQLDGPSPEAVAEEDFLITVLEKRTLNDRPLLRMRKPKTETELEAKKRLIDQFLHGFICSECQPEKLTVAPPAEHRLDLLYSPPGKPLRVDFYSSIFRESEPFIKRLKCRHLQFDKTITKLTIKEDLLFTMYYPSAADKELFGRIWSRIPPEKIVCSDSLFPEVKPDLTVRPIELLAVKCTIWQNKFGYWFVDGDEHANTDCCRSRSAAISKAKWLIAHNRRPAEVITVPWGLSQWYQDYKGMFRDSYRVPLKGRSIPRGAVYVGRNGVLGGGLITDRIHWGNPFEAEFKPPFAFRPFPEAEYDYEDYNGPNDCYSYDEYRFEALAQYWPYQRQHKEATTKFARFLQKNDAIRKRIQKELRGKILVCHCHPQLSCHGNILSRIAHEGTSFHCTEIDDWI
jgi:hypothetical protein